VIVLSRPDARGVACPRRLFSIGTVLIHLFPGGNFLEMHDAIGLADMFSAQKIRAPVSSSCIILQFAMFSFFHLFGYSPFDRA
jgi:hypothetical protein